MAATETRITQSAVSYAVTCAETFFGHALLDRGPQGCSFTAAGQIVAQRVRSIFDRLLQGVASISGNKPDVFELAKVVRSLSFSQISAVVALDELSRIQAASERLGVSEMTVLRRVRDIEHAVGKKIFVRFGSQLLVHHSAQPFVVQLNLASIELEYAKTELATVTKTGETTLRIGCVGLAHVELMPEIIHDFVAEYPRSSVRLHQGSFDTQHAMLMSGRLHVLVATERSDVDQRITGQEFLYDNEYALICRASHPLASKKTVSADELVDYEWIVPIGGVMMRKAIDDMFEQFGRKPHIALETPLIGTAIALAQISDRIAVSSAASVSAWKLDDTIKVLPFTLPGELGKVMLFYRRDLQLPKLQQDFIDAIKQAAARIRSNRRQLAEVA